MRGIIIGIPLILCASIIYANRTSSEIMLFAALLSLGILIPFIVLFYLSFKFKEPLALVLSAITMLILLFVLPVGSNSHGISPMLLILPLILTLAATPIFFGIRKIILKLNSQQNQNSYLDDSVPKYDDENLMVPPWVKFPNLKHSSMGWRMGVGEAYKDDFQSWFISQLRETELKIIKKYPEPSEWAGYYKELKKGIT